MPTTLWIPLVSVILGTISGIGYGFLFLRAKTHDLYRPSLAIALTATRLVILGILFFYLLHFTSVHLILVMVTFLVGYLGILIRKI